MVMLAEQYEYVIGGDPDRDTIDVAVLDTATGVVRGHRSDDADGCGYARLLAWARTQAPGRRVWALEGTGSFAAGLATVLAGAGEDVVEISGGKRSRGAKSDRIDAIRAARTALTREHQATPRARGLREALRQVLVTRQGILVSRTKAINELKSLIVIAPEHLRAGLRGVGLHHQLRRITELDSPPTSTIEYRVTVLTPRSIAARVQFLLAQAAELDRELGALVNAHPAGPALLTQPGVGPVVAAQLLVSWSHRGRVRSEAAFASFAGVAPLEASSGQKSRHRLAVATAISTARFTRSPSPDSAATPNPETTKRNEPRKARRTATCADRSNAPSPDASTA
jgi:transposase